MRIGSDHYGWGDSVQWPSLATGFIRGHLVKYAADENGRTRWGMESREGLQYQNVELVHFAGMMHSPKTGEMSEALILPVNGDSGQLVAIPIGDSEKRQKLPEGWSGIATPDLPDHHIQFDDQGNIHVNAPGKTVIVEASLNTIVNASSGVTINAPTITLNAPSVVINGNITHTGNNTQAGIHVNSLGDHLP